MIHPNPMHAFRGGEASLFFCRQPLIKLVLRLGCALRKGAMHKLNAARAVSLHSKVLLLYRGRKAKGKRLMSAWKLC